MNKAVIVCGALAMDVVALAEKNDWDIGIYGVSTLLHNTPKKIPLAVRNRIEEINDLHDEIIVAYGDCGTSGALDDLLKQKNINRMVGPHCFEMYGGEIFNKLMREEPGAYWLTDYLVRSFDHLVIEGMGLDKHPDLLDDYFRNYKRIVYLKNDQDPELDSLAYKAAEFLLLPLQIISNGFGEFENRLRSLIEI